MSVGLGSKARCVDTAPDGIKPYAGYAPHCFWVGQCTKEGCRWARIHQVTPDGKPRLPSARAGRPLHMKSTRGRLLIILIAVLICAVIYHSDRHGAKCTPQPSAVDC